MSDVEDKWVRCPICRHKEPIKYNDKTNCEGILYKCKGRNCGKILEITITNGVDETKVRLDKK